MGEGHPEAEKLPILSQELSYYFDSTTGQEISPNMAQQQQPAVQLISKSDFTTQHVVPVSLPTPFPPLSPGQARIRTHTISLTTNNFTYARLGGIPYLGWWDAWPMPPCSSLPAPFNEPSTLAGYCRVLAWGYSAVVESAVPGLEVGTLLFGTQPIGTLAEVVELESIEDVDGHWREVSGRRKHLNSVYNRYIARPRDDTDREGMGWDALMNVLFQSGYMLNRSVFAWEEGVKAVHPLGDPALPWTEEDADLTGAVVVMLAASGKTGLSFAREMRARRPREKQPAKVIAVGSAKSKEFTVGTGLFDEVLLYSDLEDQAFDLEYRLKGDGRKVLLMDFGARGGAVDQWAEALEAKSKNLQALIVGGDPLGKEISKTGKQTEDPASGVAQFFAGAVRDRVIEAGGAAKYFADQETAWAEFKATRTVPGLQLKRGEGLASFSEDWNKVVKGEYGTHIGLVYGFPV